MAKKSRIFLSPLADRPHGVLIDLVTGEALEFWFYKRVTLGTAVVYDEKDVRGRSEPWVHYSHTGAERLNVDITLVSDLGPDGVGDTTEVMAGMNFLRSLHYPDYDNGAYVMGPHYVQLILGDFYNEPGLIRDLSFDIGPPWDRDHLPQIVNCSLGFQRIALPNNESGDPLFGSPRGYADIRYR